jgi:hypothetical protein
MPGDHQSSEARPLLHLPAIAPVRERCLKSGSVGAVRQRSLQLTGEVIGGAAQVHVAGVGVRVARFRQGRAAAHGVAVRVLEVGAEALEADPDGAVRRLQMDEQLRQPRLLGVVLLPLVGKPRRMFQ